MAYSDTPIDKEESTTLKRAGDKWYSDKIFNQEKRATTLGGGWTWDDEECLLEIKCNIFIIKFVKSNKWAVTSFIFILIQIFIVLILVSNKSDDYLNEKVTDNEGKELVKEINAVYHRTSEKLPNESVEQVFISIGKKFLNPNSEETAFILHLIKPVPSLIPGNILSKLDIENGKGSRVKETKEEDISNAEKIKKNTRDF